MATVTLTIDGKLVTVEQGINLIEAARTLGIEIPHYCYHPGLPVVGQCRMCQVEVEKSPKLSVACSTPASPGMVVHTNSPQVVKARKAVLEFYLLNHPLDCPICDKGGECPLQDYTVTYGPGESRYREEKVKRVKALPIGPTVIFDAERCILCTRCVRFVQDIVKSGELGVFHRGDKAEIGLFPGKELDNLYSLNVVDLCPVGALTSRDYRFRARPWDLFRQVESLCPGCSFGCNIILDVRHWDEGEQIVRIRPRVNMEVNTYWMCDIGRFTFHPLYEKERLDGPWIRKDRACVPTSWEEAIALLASSLGRLIADHGPGSVGAVVSARLTNEELYLLQKFFRRLPTEHLDHRVREVQGEGRDFQEDHLLLRADRTPNTKGARDMGVLPGSGGLDTMGMIEAARSGRLKALFVFGEDLATELPQALNVQEALSKLDLLVVQAMSLTEMASLAHFILPALAFAEQDGTYTNWKGRLQRLNKAVDPPGKILSIGELLEKVAAHLGPSFPFLSLEEIWQEIAGSCPGYEGITWEAIPPQGIQLPVEMATMEARHQTPAAS
ncbi:MAG: molybdopterin-dependent oxidoreductase [candidate division NC10 bacterium]|nr:molybdopterin-dependent oxidoreductase [candidate division NC10 bacterium]